MFERFRAPGRTRSSTVMFCRRALRATRSGTSTSPNSAGCVANSVWFSPHPMRIGRTPSFRNYADYALTDKFRDGPHEVARPWWCEHHGHHVRRGGVVALSPPDRRRLPARLRPCGVPHPWSRQDRAGVAHAWSLPVRQRDPLSGCRIRLSPSRWISHAPSYLLRKRGP